LDDNSVGTGADVSNVHSVNLFFRLNIHRPTWQDWVLNQALPKKLILILLLEILQAKKF
jgi:hypothetical protein